MKKEEFNMNRLRGCNTITVDVLIVGGGGAGLMAAIEASKTVSNIAVVMKGCGSTSISSGGLAAVGPWHTEGDSKEIHFKGSFIILWKWDNSLCPVQGAVSRVP